MEATPILAQVISFLIGLSYVSRAISAFVRPTLTAQARGIDFSRKVGAVEYMTAFGALQLAIGSYMMLATTTQQLLVPALILATLAATTTLMCRACAQRQMPNDGEPMSIAGLTSDGLVTVLAVAGLMSAIIH